MRPIRPLPVIVVLGLACGGGGGGSTAPPGPPTQFNKVAGDGQNWYFNNRLPAPYTVQARDANNRGVPGVIVTWAVTSGGGAVTPTVDTTGADGTAGIIDSLGGGAATQLVTATPSTTGLPTATFTANGAAAPTGVTVTVNNNFFSPKDTAIQVNHDVTWSWNSGGLTHTVTFTSGPAPLPAEAVQSSGSHSVTFTQVGKYSYVCTLHANMNGTVMVVN